MSERLWKWGEIAAMLGGALWALTPLRQNVFGGGRFRESPIFQPYDFVVEVITMLLIVGLVALHARHKRTYGRLGTAGVVVIFCGYALGIIGSIPAVLFPAYGLQDLIMIGQDLGFLAVLIAGVGAILLGVALWLARATAARSTAAHHFPSGRASGSYRAGGYWPSGQCRTCVDGSVRRRLDDTRASTPVRGKHPSSALLACEISVLRTKMRGDCR